MSAGKMLFSLVVGVGVASGLVYNMNQQRDRPMNPERQQAQQKAFADMLSKMTGQKLPPPESALTEALPTDSEASVEIQKSLAQDDPTLAKRPVSQTQNEMMQAAIALQRRSSGKALSTNLHQDQLLQEIEDEEKANAEAAKNAPATVEGARAPAATTVVVMDGSTGVDPSAEDRILQLAVPESVKQEILNNYRRTGIMPAILEGK